MTNRADIRAILLVRLSRTTDDAQRVELTTSLAAIDAAIAMEPPATRPWEFEDPWVEL